MLAGPPEPEPDMEHDITLASCCQREIKDRRIKQNKLDHIRSGMPATVALSLNEFFALFSDELGWF